MTNEELVKEIQNGTVERMAELWEQVEGLVKWKANHVMTALQGCPGRGVEFEDLYQSGYLALVAAVEKYDPSAGSFSTWFMYHLKKAFAETSGYRTKKSWHEPINSTLSMDKHIVDEAGSDRFGDLIPDRRAAAAMEAVEEREYRRQLKVAVSEVLADIPDESREIIRLRILGDLTLRQVAEIKGSAPERIRQKEAKAIRQLRKPQNACRLLPFYEFNAYSGTSLTAFEHTGMSIQERYLILEEKRKEWEDRQRAQDSKHRKEKLQQETQELLSHIEEEAQEKVSRMTPEEKARLLAQYGYA